jgi:hypothetical protein
MLLRTGYRQHDQQQQHQQQHAPGPSFLAELLRAGTETAHRFAPSSSSSSPPSSPRAHVPSRQLRRRGRRARADQ